MSEETKNAKLTDTVLFHKDSICQAIESQFKTLGMKNTEGNDLRIQPESFKLRFSNFSSNPSIQFQSDEIQQAFPMFKSLVADDFGGYVKMEYNGEVLFVIRVHLSYKHFDGGSNGTECFVIHGRLISDLVPKIEVSLVASRPEA